MKYSLLIFLFIIALNGCSSFGTPKTPDKLPLPFAVVEFPMNSTSFNNVPAVQKLMGDSEGFAMVAYANTLAEHERAYKRFSFIAESVKKDAALYVQHMEDEAEENKVLLFESADTPTLQSAPRLVFMSDNKTALSESHYRDFYQRALRQLLPISSGSLTEQLISLGDSYGWTIAFSGQMDDEKNKPLKSLEVAFVGQSPKENELRQLITEVLSRAGVRTELNVDVKRRVMEVILK